MAAMSVGVYDIGSRGFDRLAPHRMPSQHNAAEGDETIPEKRSGRLKAFRRKAHFGSPGCPRILSFYLIYKNSGATAIGGMFRTRSVHRSATFNIGHPHAAF